MIRTPAVFPGGGAGHVPRPGPAPLGGQPSSTALAVLCAIVCLVPPLFIGLVFQPAGGPSALRLATGIAALSIPTYVAFFLAGRALLRRHPTGAGRRAMWISLKWDLAGGAVLLNASFLEYFTAGAVVLAKPVQMPVIAITDLVVFLVGAGCVEFVRGQLLRRGPR